MVSSLHRLSPAGVALLVSASIVGCRSKPSPAPPPAASSTPSSRADLFAPPDDLGASPDGDPDAGGAAEGRDDPGAPDHGLALTLQDAGAEPRAALTYDLRSGEARTAILRFTTTVKTEGETGGGGDDMPPLRLTLSVVAGQKPSADRTLVKARVTKAEIAAPPKGAPPDAAARVRELSKALEGIGATFTVSTRGAIDDAELSGDPETQAATSSLLPLIESALELFFVPVPEQAVGIGAQWTVTSAATPEAPAGAAEKTYVLKARTPTTAIVEEAQHEESSDQPIADPEAPPGSTIAVVTRETSTLGVRLTGVASSASSDEDTVMTMRDPTSSPPKTVVTRMKRSVRLESR